MLLPRVQRCTSFAYRCRSARVNGCRARRRELRQNGAVSDRPAPTPGSLHWSARLTPKHRGDQHRTPLTTRHPGVAVAVAALDVNDHEAVPKVFAG